METFQHFFILHIFYVVLHSAHKTIYCILFSRWHFNIPAFRSLKYRYSADFPTVCFLLCVWLITCIKYKYNIGDSVRYTPYCERNVDTWCWIKTKTFLLYFWTKNTLEWSKSYFWLPFKVTWGWNPSHRQPFCVGLLLTSGFSVVCKIRGALRKINDGGKWTFRPITYCSFVLPDSVNDSAQTK